ncbi:TIGR01777 family oxidoreductase [Agarivorans sp. TSD2052]|uniref:TIGR01777 family oxidoreductase n=1 Tax=Agarivorans sp. TSD2052 TaxID=2937286 RepID=UPI0020105EBE|nr:TIGR01777 family oxidoreductase [Agarivorans sp. TSD2052]UPW19861.1 TIGR01777 family oxidoreductase [Agarivorans sp. TSD2052]
MKILLTGGTGFIGCRLVKHLQFSHELTVLSRNPIKAYQKLGHNLLAIPSLKDLKDLNDYDAVINLAGEPIANKRWTEQQKQRICSSRWQLTEQIAELFKQSEHPPHTFISGSAVGYYGEQGQQELDESSIIEDDSFPHQVCKKWEQIALQAASEQTRVCLLRTGVVIGIEGGALSKLLPVFRLGLGGPIAHGQQQMSWIHISDMVEAIIFLLNNKHCQGAYNLTAPNPVSNQAFSEALAKQLKRPCLLRTPAWLMNSALGDMASLIVGGQKVLPKRLTNDGFNFRYKDLSHAFKEILARA